MPTAHSDAEGRGASASELTSGPAAGREPPAELRIRRLVRDANWARLPAAVRRRFSRRISKGQFVVYFGRVSECEFSRAGCLLAQLARLIGGPLPLSSETGGASVVTVTEDGDEAGQLWTRLYARRHKKPQIIHSAKRFAGPTGLEKHVGCGVGVTLRVEADDRALTFRSERYFVDLGRWRLWLPSWLSPGAMTVAHTEIDPDHFAFSLDLVGQWLGPLIHQRIVFEEAITDAGPARLAHS